jgi:hypothetical protein
MDEEALHAAQLRALNRDVSTTPADRYDAAATGWVSCSSPL